MARRRRSKTSPFAWLRRWIGRGVLLVLAAAPAASLWLVWPYWQLSGQLASEGAVPSRLYARPIVLAVGAAWDDGRVLGELAGLAYREVPAGRGLVPGEWQRSGDALGIYLRRSPTPTGWAAASRLAIGVEGGRVRRLELQGVAVPRVALEPQLLASYYAPTLEERRPARIEELPEVLPLAVLAAEDGTFFDHPGLSVSGVLRAAFSNLLGGSIRQGGSTLTQQLVKNLFLSHERTWGRKAREAMLALLVERRFTKRQILEAYLNAIYLGSDGVVSVLGVGAASWVYFGKDVAALDLSEAATLAGIIPAPARYSPLTYPKRAIERRNLVLDRLEQLGWVAPEMLAEARSRPLEVRLQVVGNRRAPYFADLVEREALHRLGIARLSDAGWTLLSTLEPDGQAVAEVEVQRGLDESASRVEGEQPLQAALVSVDPESGGILAYVGGRDHRESPFDRAGVARRQPGSSFKPVVYGAAFAQGVALPSSRLRDAPFTLRLAGRSWTPGNSDGRYRGWVTARTALEESLNVPTARLAMELGLERVVALARAMGVESKLDPVPALALGASALTPRELAGVYAVLAAGGRRAPVHALSAVLDRAGAPLAFGETAKAASVLDARSTFLVTSVLQGVLTRGTARTARQLGLSDPLAGKTGTSNDRRDGWFAGYAPSRATVVWVGYDDNRPTGLSGARVALPIWARFMAAMRPPTGYPAFVEPPGLVSSTIDPESGELATSRCPEAVTELYPAGQQPGQTCHLH